MGKRALAATVLLVGVVAAQDGAAWKLPAAGPEVLLKLKLSKRTYILGPESRAPKEADGPERIQPKRESYDQGLLKVARYQIEHGELDKAEKLIAEVVERNTADAGALTLKALLLHKQGKPKQALAALRESLIQNRRNPDAWRLLRQVAKDLGRKVVRPRFRIRAWVKQVRKGIEVAFAPDTEKNFPWIYYASARAVYRYEGEFQAAFPEAKEYRFTFREQLFAIGALVRGTESEQKENKVASDLKRLLRESRKKDVVAYVFWATYPEPLPATPEACFGALRPKLERYFDEHIVVNR
ncbi:MAG: hypothetical protein O7C98_07495 [Planctomycetota bacterium]|nr:hypothetical protein [Planctomycetota bacterium]